MDTKIVKEKISLDALKEIAKEQYGDMVKAAVDVARETVALGGELHSDANEKLLEAGSEQKNIWGINIYPDRPKSDWIEFTSLINIRPSASNRSMIIQDKALQQRITDIINALIV